MYKRQGPNKVGLIGILQPFSDAIKLFLKERNIPMLSNYLIYIIRPVLGLFNSLLLWVIYPYLINYVSFNIGIIFFVVVQEWEFIVW